MYWYDFGRNDVYVGNGGKFKYQDDCKAVSAEEKQRITDFFAEHLLKIYFDDERSYDNSDDERASDSYHSSSSYAYREVDTEKDLYGVVMRDGEITGVVFYVKSKSSYDPIWATVFNFNGKPKT